MTNRMDEFFKSDGDDKKAEEIQKMLIGNSIVVDPPDDHVIEGFNVITKTREMSMLMHAAWKDMMASVATKASDLYKDLPEEVTTMEWEELPPNEQSMMKVFVTCIALGALDWLMRSGIACKIAEKAAAKRKKK